MKMDEIYKMLGYGLVCLFIVYIVTKSIRFQISVVEGLVGRKENSPTTDVDEEPEDRDDSEEQEA